MYGKAEEKRVLPHPFNLISFKETSSEVSTKKHWMFHMGIVRQLEELSVHFWGEKIPNKEDARILCADWLKHSSYRFYLVAGELNPEVFNDEIIDTLNNNLDNNPDYTAQLLFWKSGADFESSIKELWSDNQSLVQLFLKDSSRNRMHLYLASQRPRFHFWIADDNVLLEKHDHKPYDDHESYSREDDKKFAKNYIKTFNRMINYSDKVREIKVNDFREFMINQE